MFTRSISHRTSLFGFYVFVSCGIAGTCLIAPLVVIQRSPLVYSWGMPCLIFFVVTLAVNAFLLKFHERVCDYEGLYLHKIRLEKKLRWNDESLIAHIYIALYDSGTEIDLNFKGLITAEQIRIELQRQIVSLTEQIANYELHHKGFVHAYMSIAPKNA